MMLMATRWIAAAILLAAFAMLAAYSFAVVRVVSSLMGLRPSRALRGDGGDESSMRTMAGIRSTGTS